nr:hypothetical protein Iba_chr02dCG3560 [Ipomoea batatas]
MATGSAVGLCVMDTTLPPLLVGHLMADEGRCLFFLYLRCEFDFPSGMQRFIKPLWSWQYDGVMRAVISVVGCCDHHLPLTAASNSSTEARGRRRFCYCLRLKTEDRHLLFIHTADYRHNKRTSGFGYGSEKYMEISIRLAAMAAVLHGWPLVLCQLRQNATYLPLSSPSNLIIHEYSYQSAFILHHSRGDVFLRIFLISCSHNAEFLILCFHNGDLISLDTFLGYHNG